MHRVLKPLDELLELGDSRLEHSKPIVLEVGAGRPFRLMSRFGTAANLADPRDQPLKLAHSSPLDRTLGRYRAGRIPPTLFLRHLADHQRTALDLLTHHFELRLALLRRSLPCGLHRITSRRVTIGTNLPLALGACPEFPACVIDPDAPTAFSR